MLAGLFHGRIEHFRATGPDWQTRINETRGGLAPGGKEFSASPLDRGLGFWN